MNELRVALIAAVVASVLTFSAGRLNDFLNRVRKRNVLNLNALVKLEHLLNGYGMVINDNRQNLETLVNTMGHPGALPLNRLSLLSIDEDIKINLLDIKLINDITEIEYTLRRFNDDSEMINYHLNSFQTGVISASIDQTQYAVFLGGLLGQAAELKAYILETLDQIAETVAHVRLRQKIDKSTTAKLLSRMSRLHKRNLTDDEIQAEKTKVLKEIEASRKKSVDDKNRILKKIQSKK